MMEQMENSLSALRIRVDGRYEPLPIAISHSEICAALGGCALDVVTLWKYQAVMYVDDMGYAKGLPVNAEATRLYHEHCGPGARHSIVGDVVVAPWQEDGAENE